MYAEHQPQLSRLGRSGPEGFRRIAVFALCTIRVQLHRAVADYPLALSGRPCGAIWGWKHLGLIELEEKAAAYHDLLEQEFATLSGEEREDCMLHTVTAIPGLGPAKGGFVLQMVYGISGCLDSHNLRRFGIPETTFKIAGRIPKKRSALISEYNRAVHRLGGTQALWDSWCCYMAELDANYAGDPNYVSRLHLAPLKD